MKPRRLWKRHLSKSCAEKDQNDEGYEDATKFLDRITVDISVYPSRQDYKYLLLFTDIATKMIWKYPLKEESGDDEVLQCVREFVEV